MVVLLLVVSFIGDCFVWLLFGHCVFIVGWIGTASLLILVLDCC
jgi:hypothetical protein